MTTVLSKKEYLQRLLELSEAMIAAFEVSDVDIAGELYDERERFVASVTPDNSSVPDGLLDQVLKRDQDVIAAASAHRMKMLDSAAHLKAVRGYTSGLPMASEGGDWGSG